MKKIKCEGVVIEIRRVSDLRYAGYAGEIPIHTTYGWMAKVLLRRGVLNSEPIEIPFDTEDEIGIQDVIEVEMTVRKPVSR